MDKIYARYGHAVDFYAIYIREAHPSDGWSMISNEAVGINVAQPTSTRERAEVAGRCAVALDMAIPLLVDEIDDFVGNQYSGFPDRLYVIDKEGTVAYKGGRGPFGFSPREMEQSLVLLLVEDALKSRSPDPDQPPARDDP